MSVTTQAFPLGDGVTMEEVPDPQVPERAKPGSTDDLSGWSVA